jgi:hypothetical protein
MKAILAWIGFVTILLSVCVLFLIGLMRFSPPPKNTAPAPLDSELIANAPPPGVPTEFTCRVQFPQIEKIQRLNHSLTIVASVAGFRELPCRTKLEVSASAFKVEPKSVDVKMDRNPPGAKLVFFSVLPQEVGEQQLIFQRSDGHDIYTIEVQQYPGIPPGVSQWFPLVTTLFGGILTIPWWLERIERRKRRDDL